MNGDLRLQSNVISADKGKETRISVFGNAKNFAALEKELVIKTLRILGISISKAEEEKVKKNVDTRSAEASLSNYKGEMAMEKAEDLKKKGKKGDADKELKNAKKNFEKAIKIDPQYEKAKKNLSKLPFEIPMTL